MIYFKQIQSKHNKRIKTESTGYSAFDQSIILLVLSKIHKALQDISKTKFQSLKESIYQINKDLNLLSSQCKHKQTLNLLVIYLNISELIHSKKYSEALQTLQTQSSHFNEKTNKIARLSIQLLEVLILKHLSKQQESKNLMKKAIKNLDLTHLKIKPKSFQQKIIESIILCISITGQHFAKFQSQSFDYRQIYTEAYRISQKYLTQYHKLTQTLFTICRKYAQQNDESIKKSKRKSLKTVKKRKSLNSNFNRYFLKDQKSQKSYLNHTIQPKTRSTTLNDSSEYSSSIRNTQIPKRLRTIEACIDLRQEKQLCLSKLYGTDLKEAKQKTVFDKKYFKRGKISTSLKPFYERNDAVEMKELQKISKLYLPKLQEKKKVNQKNGKEKLNAADVLKFSSTLSRLKPGYFDRINSQGTDRIIYSQVRRMTINDTNQTKSTKKIQSNPSGTQRPSNLGQNSFQSLAIQKDLKEKLLTPLKQSSNPHGISENSQENCQLI